MTVHGVNDDCNFGRRHVESLKVGRLAVDKENMRGEDDDVGGLTQWYLYLNLDAVSHAHQPIRALLSRISN